MVNVSVMVSVHKSDVISKCLRAAQKQNPYELIVIADNCDNETRKIIDP